MTKKGKTKLLAKNKPLQASGKKKGSITHNKSGSADDKSENFETISDMELSVDEASSSGLNTTAELEEDNNLKKNTKTKDTISGLPEESESMVEKGEMQKEETDVVGEIGGSEDAVDSETTVKGKMEESEKDEEKMGDVELEKETTEEVEIEKGKGDEVVDVKGTVEEVEIEKRKADEVEIEGPETDKCETDHPKPISEPRSGDMEFPEISIGKLYGPPKKRTPREKARVYLTTVVVAILVGLSIFSYIRFTAPVTGFDSDGDGMPDAWEKEHGFDPNDNSDAKQDGDGDGLTNLEEYRYNIPNSFKEKKIWWGGTDPRDPDSDSDKMMDGWEVRNNLDPLNEYDAILDPDNDGVVFTVNNVTLNLDFSNLKEYQAETDPIDPDTDHDGMLDGWEDFFKLFPLSPIDAEKDNDGDGLLNSWEFSNGTNPSNNDTDSDGLDDLLELISYGTNPLLRDTDGDGMPDGWEMHYGLNPLDGNDENMDGDGDELANWREYYHGTNPYNNDTDSDKMPDGWEVEMGWDPENGTMEIDPTNPDGAGDPDKDILSNLEEFIRFIDPLDYDTDKDGLNDGLEAVIGFPGKLVDGVFLIDDLTNRYFTDPISPDTDHDGINDLEETRGGTNASNADSDGDGLDDNEEQDTYHTSPVHADTDWDRLTDWEEVKGTIGYITNPQLQDTDGDGLSDGDEVLTDYLPYKDVKGLFPGHPANPLLRDTDGDGMLDGWEAEHGLTRVIRNDTGPNLILEYSAEIGLSTWFDKDYVYLKYNWDGNSWEEFLDRDGDGLIDPELPPVYIINPVLSMDRLYDPDNDDIYNYEEYGRFREITGMDNSTDPLKVDSDGDGMPDSWELEYLTYFPDSGKWGPNPLRWDSWDDPDKDGCHYEIDGKEYYHPFVNIEEYWWSNFYSNHCSPNSSDVDDNGIPDGEEIWKHSYDGGISSGDGLANGWECLFGAYNLYIYGPKDYIPSNIMPLHFNPFTNDSNGDGVLDRDDDPDGDNYSNQQEFFGKTDPSDPLSFPLRSRAGEDEYHQIALSQNRANGVSLENTGARWLDCTIIFIGIIIVISRKRSFS